MKISIKEVEHIADLARLAIPEEEVGRFAEQLTPILEHIDKLNELNTDDINPTSHISASSNVFREDKAAGPFADKSPMDSAPQKEHKHYKVPKIIE